MTFDYRPLVDQVLNDQVFPVEDIRGKHVLVIGGFDLNFSYGNMPVGGIAQDYFAQRGAASFDGAVLFCPHAFEVQQINIDELDQSVGGKKYDVVALIEGLEKSRDLLKAVAAIKNVCAPQATVFIMARTPLELGTKLRLSFYEDAWRFSMQHLKCLFRGYALEMELSVEPAYFSIAKFRKDGLAECPCEGEEVAYSCRLQRGFRYGEDVPKGFFGMNVELTQIGTDERTDKCWFDHNYLDKYEFFLKEWKNRSFRLLELGVLDGASERMWKRYFPQADILGVDINPACQRFKEDRIKILIRDLSKDAILDELKKLQPDLIVDDASHIWSHQIQALFALFPVLPSGGIYILEDLETSLNLDLFPGFADCDIDAYTVCERISRVAASKRPCLEGVYHEEITQIGMATELVAILKGSCIFIKK